MRLEKKFMSHFRACFFFEMTKSTIIRLKFNCGFSLCVHDDFVYIYNMEQFNYIAICMWAMWELNQWNLLYLFKYIHICLITFWGLFESVAAF